MSTSTITGRRRGPSTLRGQPQAAALSTEDAVQARHLAAAAGVSAEAGVAITYAELRDAEVAWREQQGQNPRNLVSTLRAWLAFLGKADDALVGTEFTVDFSERRDAFLEASGKSGQSMVNLRSHLTQWRDGFLDRQNDHRARSYHDDLTIAAVLGPALDKLGLRIFSKPLVDELKVHGWHNVVRKWLSGTRPTTASIPTLKWLEGRLGLPAGYLTRFAVTRKRWRDDLPSAAGHTQDQSLIDAPYQLPFDEWPAELRRDWAAWVHHKTVADPAPLHRSKRGNWSMGANGQCASESLYRTTVAQFLGFLVLPRDAADPMLRGLGMSREALTFAMLGDTELWKAYLQFRFVRRGVYSTYTPRLLQTQQSMTNAKFGFVRQKPAVFMPQLAYLGSMAPTTVDAFNDWCQAQWRESQRHLQVLESGEHFKRVRDPNRVLADILERQHPMEFVFEVIDRMEKDRPSRYASPQSRASFEAMLFTLVAFAAVPLRAQTWLLAKVDEQIKYRDGRMFFSAPKEMFKNRRYLKRDYTVPIADWAVPYFERYLHVWRPLLDGAKAGSPYVLAPAIPSGRASLSSHRPIGIAGLRARFKNVTKEYGGIALAIHWIRHVAATEFIKNHPGNFLAASAILNDKLETVLREYGHLQAGDHFQLYNDHLNSLVGRRAV